MGMLEFTQAVGVGHDWKLALASLHDWEKLTVRHGILLRLLAAMQEVVTEAKTPV
ncbi:MAG: hypothetical protein ACYDBB_19720 [Armatimonadota bacterium]